MYLSFSHAALECVLAPGLQEGCSNVRSKSNLNVVSFPNCSLSCHRSMQSVATTLGSILSDRSSQIGAYSITIVPSLNGAAATSAALCLDDGRDDWMAAGTTATTATVFSGATVSSVLTAGGGAAGGGVGSGLGGGHAAQRCVFEHSRWFHVDAEEHHLVSGPDAAKAARLFGEGVVEYVVQLHQRSLHLVLQLRVCSDKGVWGVEELLREEGRKVRWQKGGCLAERRAGGGGGNEAGAYQ